MSHAQPQTLDRRTDTLCALALTLGWASEFFQNKLLYPRPRLALANLPSVGDALGTTELRGNLCRSESLNCFGELHEQSQKKTAQSARIDLRTLHKVHFISGMNLLLQIQNALGLSSSIRLVADYQTFVIVESSAGRCYSAEVTKRGQLRKNSVRVWSD